MNREEKIKNQVQKTLDCLDRAEPVKTDAFFYTRLQSRINALNRRKLEKRDLAATIYKLAFILLIVALNLYTAVLYIKGQYEPRSSREQLLNRFAEELTLDSRYYNPVLLADEQE